MHEYALGNAIDPHGPDGALIKDTSVLTCTVGDVAVIGKAAVSKVTCAGKRPEGTTLSAAHTHVATAKGLWLTAKAPRSAKAVKKLTKQAPYLLTKPRKWSGEKRKEASEETCSTTIAPRKLRIAGKSVEAWCRNHACTPDMAYQYSQTRCFADDWGLVKASKLGEGAPNEAHLTRTK